VQEFDEHAEQSSPQFFEAHACRAVVLLTPISFLSLQASMAQSANRTMNMRQDWSRRSIQIFPSFVMAEIGKLDRTTVRQKTEPCGKHSGRKFLPLPFPQQGANSGGIGLVGVVRKELTGKRIGGAQVTGLNQSCEAQDHGFWSHSTPWKPAMVVVEQAKCFESLVCSQCLSGVIERDCFLTQGTCKWTLARVLGCFANPTD